MNHKKIMLCILAVLLALTAVLAVIWLTSRDSVPEGAVAVDAQGKRMYLQKNALEKERVTGTLMNGKGKETAVDAMGAQLSDVLVSLGIDLADVSAVRVTAQDAFSTEVAAEEIAEPGKVYLTVSADGITLVVFGDSNARRNVKHAAAIEVLF